MQAAMETLTWPVAKPVFRTCSKGVTMGERSFRKRDASSFDLWTLLFADDCAIFFNSRADLGLLRYLFNRLRRFGLMMPRPSCLSLGTQRKQKGNLESILNVTIFKFN